MKGKENKMEDEIDLREMIKMFWSKRVLIASILVIFAIIGYIYSNFFVTPKYTATATLILAQKNAETDSSVITSTDLTLNDKLIGTYKELAQSNSIVRSVLSNLNMQDMSDSALKSEINVTAVTGTQILKISITDISPDRAKILTNELTNVFSKKVADIYKIDNISVVDAAETPTSSNVSHAKNIVIFAAVGLILAIGIIILMNMLDTTVKDSKDIEKALGLPVLAELPLCDFFGKKRA